MTSDGSLFGSAKRKRPRFDPTRPHALVHVPTADGCPSCGGPVSVDVWRQDALLVHGGHGATERVERRYCVACGWDRDADRAEERPPRAAS